MARYNKPRRGAKKSVARRGRKSVGRRRQPAKVAKRGLPKRQTLQSNLGGLTMTRFVSARRPNAVARHIKMAGASNYINITYPGVMASGGGFQTNSSWFLSAGNDLRRIWASIQGYKVNKIGTNGVEAVGSATAPNPPNASFRFVLESAISQLNLANTSATPVNIELHDILLTLVPNLSTGT